jgi:hypothetical protein
MANTTNFNWETPDDTDLVKDGALAIRTLGSAIDTSLVDLKGGTTDQVLAKNSNTDMDFKWVADASGIPATIFDAKGDLIAASAADTAARLAVGANGTVLTADSSETTGLKWATPASGGMTQIATGNLDTGSTATTISSIPTTYKNLQLVLRDFSWSGNIYLRLRINGITSSSYGYAGIDHSAVNTFVFMGEGAVSSMLTSGNSLASGADSLLVFDLSDYANTVTNKIIRFNGIAKGSSWNKIINGVGQCQTTDAITSITVATLENNFTAGSYILYGVN